MKLKSPDQRRWYIAGISLLLLAAFVWKSRDEHSADDITRIQPDSALGFSSTAGIDRTTEGASSPNMFAGLAEVNSSLPSTSLALLARIRKQLSQAESKFASQQIRLELDSGRNKLTGLGFLPRPDGSLGESPATRTFLLDVWVEIDLPAASAYSDMIFERSGDADEWALALRNRGKELGEENAHANEAFTSRIKQYLQQSSWLREPTAGYLHGFDAAVYSRQPELGVLLARIIDEKPHVATVYAAQLSLNRMAAKHFAPVMDALRSTPTSLDSSPKIRASLMARASLGYPVHRKLVEDYLSDQRIAADEKKVFFNAFPNGHTEISFNLLTRHSPEPLLQLAVQDAVALQIAREWQRSERFAEAKPEVAELVARLSALRASAQRGIQGIKLPD